MVTLLIALRWKSNFSKENLEHSLCGKNFEYQKDFDNSLKEFIMPSKF